MPYHRRRVRHGGRRRTAVLAHAALCGALLLAGCGQLTEEPAPTASPSVPASAPASGPDGAQDSGTLPGLPSAEQARARLAELTVAVPGSMDGYRRSAFDHWSSQGNSCNTREAVLERDGDEVRRDEECRAVAGRWYSPFDGRTLTDASDLDIDHLVPLANAWRSGAADWDDARREAFANDLSRPQLIAVSATANRAKGDRSPDEWLPPEDAFHCVYGRAWTAVKAHYGLTVTEAERAALGTLLHTCPG